MDVEKYKQESLVYWKEHPESLFDDKTRDVANGVWEVINQLPAREQAIIGMGLIAIDHRWCQTEGFIDFAHLISEEMDEDVAAWAAKVGL